MRDEHGMEPLDALFSSPEKARPVGEIVDDDEEDSEEEMEMDIDYSTGTIFQSLASLGVSWC